MPVDQEAEKEAKAKVKAGPVKPLPTFNMLSTTVRNRNASSSPMFRPSSETYAAALVMRASLMDRGMLLAFR